MSVNSYPKMYLPFLGVVASMFLYTVAWDIFFKKRNRQLISTKPRIHVWTHNGLTMAAADADVELAIQQRERYRLAVNLPAETPIRIRPAYFALFSEKFKWTDYCMLNSMHELVELMELCVVVRTEMEVPENVIKVGASGAISVITLWKLITNCRDAEFHPKPATV
ncbi:MAG: hypothetical protein Q7S09_04285 [bacterium]|nr:hypothetical protein [bacterium]